MAADLSEVSMRLVWIGILVGAVAATRPGAAQPLPEAGPAVQVIRADEIAAAGLTRLSDVFQLVDGWYTTSVEGYSWHASAAGLAPADAAAWTVLVDGQPVDPGVLGVRNLDLLPLHLAQVDSIVVVSEPDTRFGVFAPAGLLHIATRTPAPGAAVRGSVDAGNEVDDPGPFRYTDRSSPNIDRSGPLFLAEATARAEGFSVRASYKADEFHVTDPLIRERVYSLYEGIYAPRLLAAAPALFLRLDTGRTHHGVMAGFTRFHDLLFWAPFGRELPALHRIAHAGLTGRRGTATSPDLRYRIGFTSHDLDPRPNQLELDPGWRQDRLRSDVEVYAGSGRLRGSVGAGLDYTQSITNHPLRDPSLLVTRAYGRLDAQPLRRWRQEAAVALTHTYDRLGVQALLRAMVRPAPSHRLGLTLTVLRRTIEEENSVWYWRALGYTFLQPDTLALESLPYLPLATTATADLSWDGRLSASLSGGLRVYARRFFQHYVPTYRFDFDVETDGFRTTTRVVPGVDGRVVGGAARLRWQLGPYLEQRLAYDYTRPVWSNEAFAQAWSDQPWHQASYTVRFAPVDRFSLFAQLRHRSATTWPAFAPASAATGGRYPDRLPAYWLLDVTARKLFWRDHVATSLSLRNLLNEPYRTHPAGAVTHLTFTFNLQVYFGTGEASP